MKGCAGFWVGMSAGLLAGAAMGMMSPYGRDPMKTQVGKSITASWVSRWTTPWTTLYPICAEQKEQGGLRPALLLFCRGATGFGHNPAVYCTAGLRCHFLSFSVYRQRMALRMAKNATPTSANTASPHGGLAQRAHHQNDGFHRQGKDDVLPHDPQRFAGNADGCGDLGGLIVHQDDVGSFDGGVASPGRPWRCRCPPG